MSKLMFDYAALEHWQQEKPGDRSVEITIPASWRGQEAMAWCFDSSFGEGFRLYPDQPFNPPDLAHQRYERLVREAKYAQERVKELEDESLRPEQQRT